MSVVLHNSFPPLRGFVTEADFCVFDRTITLTRKLFTMILSVIVYDHKLTLGQWAGAGVVFAGIGVEAAVKRKGDPEIFSLPLRVLLTDYPFRHPHQASRPRKGKSQDQVAIVLPVRAWTII